MSQRKEKQWYDSEIAIANYAKSLDGIHKLAIARHEAGYERNEKLSEWCILGYFFADGYGNFCPITNGAPADGYLKNCLPSVIPRYDMGRYTDHYVVTYKNAVPPLTETCCLCDLGWDLSNIRDYFQYENKPLHGICRRKNIFNKTIDRLTSIIIESGIKFSKIESIPNEYCVDEDYFGPWIIISTCYGCIKIGDRKRVTNIDWSDTKQKIYFNESVTKSDYYIHAWSDEDTCRYLKRIWENLTTRQ